MNTIVRPPATGTLIQMVDAAGARTPLGFSFGWSTRSSTEEEQTKLGLCPESFAVMATGPHTTTQDLGASLKAISPVEASSSGTGGNLHLMVLDANGKLQNVQPFNFALVKQASPPEPDQPGVPFADEIWVSNTHFMDSPDPEVKAAFAFRQTDCLCEKTEPPPGGRAR